MLSWVRSKASFRKTSSVVEQLNEFKNIAMPYLPLKFVTNAQNDLVVPKGTLLSETAIGTSMRKRLNSAWSQFQKHFHVDTKLEDISQLDTLFQKAMPSLQSIQDHSHKDVFVAAWLLLM
jgi:hypothetical protein